MKVTVLGCGGSAGVPTLGGQDGRGDWGHCDPGQPLNRRTRSSILIDGEHGGRLLVDAGPDLRAQLLRNGVGRIDALFITHAHADHVMGLDEVRPLNRALGAAIPVYATSDTMDALKVRFDYIFRSPTPPVFFRPALTPHIIHPGEVVEMAGMEVTLFRQDHKVMETIGLRLGSFAYSTDVVAMPAESMSVLQGVDTWIVGCFQRHPHAVHAHLDLVQQWRRHLQPRRTILTHMGQDLDWDWMSRNLPDGLEAAYDGMVLEL
ncbi:MBL fold metallo-hydrolase [Teichococcus globiformis]|uniref:MBL fold metallo-hydrolase n=1 Tax=Teichococcus globiformis TaxID=2307229 RepID=UPI0036D20E35